MLITRKKRLLCSRALPGALNVVVRGVLIVATCCGPCAPLVMASDKDWVQTTKPHPRHKTVTRTFESALPAARRFHPVETPPTQQRQFQYQQAQPQTNQVQPASAQSAPQIPFRTVRLAGATGSHRPTRQDMQRMRTAQQLMPQHPPAPSPALPSTAMPITEPRMAPATPVVPQQTQQPQQHVAQQPPATTSSYHAPNWWRTLVQNPMRPAEKMIRLSIEDLLMRALTHSAQIKVFSELPLIRETSIVETDAAFDWTAYFDTRWDDLNDPVGNTLTVGGNGTRFKDEHLVGSGGVRKRTRIGGQFDASQQFGYQRTNSQFFLPNPQGTSRLRLSYTQPLLRGNGRVYNESFIALARIDTKIADDEFSRQLQSHLLEIVRAYWGLYLERGALAQKHRSYERAVEIQQRLESRRHIDVVEAQIISAEAEVAARQSQLRRSAMAVKNAEDRIRALVNDPELSGDELELIPVDHPTEDAIPVDMASTLSRAIRNRPEVSQALKQIRAGCIRAEMSKKELLPLLNLVTEAYVAGLRGRGHIDGAFADQFSTGAPGYSIGLQYEVPLGNRAARTRHIRRHLELRQLKNQYTTTVETLKLETKVAVREVNTSFDEVSSKARAMAAALAKTRFIERRWELLPGENQSASIVLENVLAAQTQLNRTEFEYLNSLMTYNIALINLKRATGELLTHEHVEIGRTTENRLPTHVLSKPQLNSATMHAQPQPSGSLPPATSYDMVPQAVPGDLPYPTQSAPAVPVQRYPSSQQIPMETAPMPATTIPQTPAPRRTAPQPSPVPLDNYSPDSIPPSPSL